MKVRKKLPKVSEAMTSLKERLEHCRLVTKVMGMNVFVQIQIFILIISEAFFEPTKRPKKPPSRIVNHLYINHPTLDTDLLLTIVVATVASGPSETTQARKTLRTSEGWNTLNQQNFPH